MAVAFTAYLYGAQHSGIITDADMIRITDKTVDVHQSNAKNEQNRALLPAIIESVEINEKGNSDEKANNVENLGPQSEAIETNNVTVKNVESHSSQGGSSGANAKAGNSTVDSPPAAMNHKNDSNTVLNRTNEKNAENKIPAGPEINNGPTNENIASPNETIANKSSDTFDGSGAGDNEAIPNRFQMNDTDEVEVAESPNSNISVQNVKIDNKRKKINSRTGAKGPLIRLNKHQIVNIPKANGDENAGSINQLASSNKIDNNAQSTN